MVKIPTQYVPFQLNFGVRYQEIKPSEHLKELIVCFWRIENNRPEATLYPVLPDGTVDFVGDLYGDPQLRFSSSQAVMMELPLPPFSTLWGVRFYPAVFTTLFGIPMPELKHEILLEINTLGLAPAFAFLTEPLAESEALEHKKSVFERHLSGYLRSKQIRPDDRFFNILHAIYLQNGALKVEKELNFGFCSRQLRRVSENYLGFSPKFFSKIVQMQHAVKGLLRPDYSCYDSGFYDQAHFIREIKAFTGLNPTALKKKMRGQNQSSLVIRSLNSR